MDFQFSESKMEDKVSILTLAGRLTAATSPQLRDKLKQLTEENRVNILLDMSAVSFLDSSGLATLVSGLKAARERGGWLKLAGLTPAVLQILKLTQLDRVLGNYPNIETALHS